MSVYLREHERSNYLERTKFNADKSDLTIAFTVDQFTAGERQTRKLATEFKYMHIDLNRTSETCAARDIHNRLAGQFGNNGCGIINIAGNGVFTLNKHGWTQDQANQYLFDVFIELRDKWGDLPTKGFRSGGQTGVDIAAAVIAEAMGVDAVITFPKGYRQRGSDAQDFYERKEGVMQKIKAMSALIDRKQS